MFAYFIIINSFKWNQITFQNKIEYLKFLIPL